jgi:hypothetical protein
MSERQSVRWFLPLPNQIGSKWVAASNRWLHETVDRLPIVVIQ